MKIVIFDGGPRRGWNTAAMCKSFANGATEKGADVKTIRLYSYSYTGCRSCFACKTKDGASYGRCAWRDGASELLDVALSADGITFASPIYFGNITPQMHAFVERLFFPLITYRVGYPVLTQRRPETAVIFTMNVKEEIFLSEYIGKDGGGPIGFFERTLTRVFSAPERVCAFNTYQFTNYEKYDASCWDVAEKTKWREEKLPEELQNAYAAGANMAEKILKRQ